VIFQLFFTTGEEALDDQNSESFMQIWDYDRFFGAPGLCFFGWCTKKNGEPKSRLSEHVWCTKENFILAL
jgi:hypothetical protein